MARKHICTCTNETDCRFGQARVSSWTAWRMERMVKNEKLIISSLVYFCNKRFTKPHHLLQIYYLILRCTASAAQLLYFGCCCCCCFRFHCLLCVCVCSHGTLSFHICSITRDAKYLRFSTSTFSFQRTCEQSSEHIENVCASENE